MTDDFVTGDAVEQPNTPPEDAEAVAARKRKKKEKKKAEEAEATRREAVAEAEAERERAEKERSMRSRLAEYLNPRRHPVVVAVAVLCLAALVAMSVLAVLFTQRADELSAMQQRDRDEAAAETVAGEYAVGAATFSHNDIPAWAEALKAGTAKELESRFDVAVKTLTPLIQEVQWSQTAELITATTVDVRADRQFVVQVFVSTRMTSTQNPNGLNIITPYTITLDRDDDWLITDVADIAGVSQDGSMGTGVPDLGNAGEQPPTRDAETPQPAPTP